MSIREREAERIADTIEELYRWKATGPHDVEPEPVNMRELVEHVLREANYQGAVDALRALFEEADYQAQREYPAPDRLREAILRADAWLTAHGGQ